MFKMKFLQKIGSRKLLNWLVDEVIITIIYNDFVTYINFIFSYIDAMKICWKFLQFVVGLTVIRIYEFLWKMQNDSIHKNHDDPDNSNILADSLRPWKFLTLEHKNATLLRFF